MARRKSLSDRATELRQLAGETATAALTAGRGYQTVVLDAAETLTQIADSLERKVSAVEPAVLVLPNTATPQEVMAARTRQSVRYGQEVYLPSWASVSRALPDVFLRTALFSSSTSVQKQNSQVLAGDRSLLLDALAIASFRDTKLICSGYRLCQYDRQVYATCLEYYRERPLAPRDCAPQIRVSFYEFADRMGGTHNAKTYLAIRASLLRLSFAHIRLRYERLDIEVPTLLSVSFEDGGATGDMRGADTMLLAVAEPVAELFGVAAWTAVDKAVADYDGLRGWLASFYATHGKAQWLSVEALYRVSGYESRMTNFRVSLTTALDRLMDPATPLCSRVARYQFSENQAKILVVREEWLAGRGGAAE